MKTAVSLPDELYQQAEELARRSGKSRSQLYRDALTEYLARRSPPAVTAALDEVVRTVGDQADDWLHAGARDALERSEW